MKYFVKKDDQQLGPYTLAELNAQLTAGAIAQTDLVQSEGMADWMPVAQVIGNIPIPTTASGAAAAPAPEPLETVPLAPNMHWALLLVIDVVTRGYFNPIWALVQANWARKLDKNNKPLVLVAMYPAGLIAGIIASMNDQEVLGVILILAGYIIYIVGVFSIKSAMEAYYTYNENIGLSLSGAMTFFFSSVYLQYHINRIARWKKTGILK